MASPLWRSPRYGRRLWLILAALALLAGAAVAGYILVPPYYYRYAAEQALARYDYDAAAKHLDACLKSRPNDAEILLLAARTARRRGAYDDAERYLARRERLQGAAAGARERALLRAQQGDLAEVETPLRELVENNDPDAPLALEALARGYFLDNRIDQTLDCLDLLLDRRPDCFPALLLRGRVLESLRDDDGAAKDYERAVSLGPTSAEARLRYADTLSRLGRTRDAVGQYECLRQHPHAPPDGIVGLARCRYDLNEMAEARRLLDALLAEAPDHVAGLVERGRLALRDNRPDDAERDLRRAVSLAPFDRDAQLVLFHCLQAQGKGDDASAVRERLGRIEADLMRITNLKAKVGDFPNDPALRREIGVLYLGLGEERQGRSWLSSADEAAHRRQAVPKNGS